MKSETLRRRFVDYFQRHGHAVVPSSSLIPANDPTLLFSNAGMNQFKDVFTGRERRDYTTAVSVQKCVRAGGKHNDLDNVGYTARHHTFFEMLGNFSFGDYFKDRAIELAWRFLTDELGVPAEKLYVTVYEKDDEAFDIWRDQVGVPESRIFRFGDKDNFWAMGETGPCGPCSEIFYDYGDRAPGPADPYKAIESGSDRLTEIWNLVFMQYNRRDDGELEPLPNPSIDTGMGLERMCSVLQDAANNYDTDLFRDVMNPLAGYMGLELGVDDRTDTALRVIADHLRAMAFLIADGVAPSNEGRGYVLRRIMRRAMRYGKQAGQTEPFLHKVVGFVVDKMGGWYPELVKERAQIELLVKVEERQFDATLSKGMPILIKYLEQFAAEKREKVPGQVALFMYGTHGFPIDLMEDVARDYGLGLDHAEYQRLMDEEARASQTGGDFSAKKVHPQLEADAMRMATVETCHQGLKGEGSVLRILCGDTVESLVSEGLEAELILDVTPFYAESGGQVGDQGLIRAETGVFRVEDTVKVLDRLVIHRGRVIEGSIREGQRVEAEVDGRLRRRTMKNHTATHLLHQALRQILGLHVRQAGSLVDPDKLRFDFSHFSPLEPAAIAEIENLVNDQIMANTPVETVEMPLAQARQSGAIAFFGEKYGAEVRVVGVGDFSKEFCGGAHVAATGEIGCFKIVAERGLAAGVRRLTALTGPEALARFRESERIFDEVRDRFSMGRDELVDQLQRAQEERKTLEQKVEELKLRLAKGGGSEERIEEVKGFQVIVKKVSDVDGGQIRQLADELLQRLKDGVVLLGSDLGDKAQLLVKTNRQEVHAGNLVRAMAAEVGGKGGGRPDMAMAGGKDVAKLEQALEKGLDVIKNS